MPPLVEMLEDAVQGRVAAPHQEAPIQNITARLSKLDLYGPRGRIQQDLSIQLTELFFPGAFEDLFSARCSTLFPDYAEKLTPADFGPVVGILENYKGPVAANYFKTAIGGWNRFHEAEVRTCVFGCAAPDKLQHYCMCPRLRRLIHSADGVRVQKDPAKWLCANLNEHDMHILIRVVAAAFGVYHHIKHDDELLQ